MSFKAAPKTKQESAWMLGVESLLCYLSKPASLVSLGLQFSGMQTSQCVEDSPRQQELVTLMAAGDLTGKPMFMHQNDATVLGGTLCQLHMDPLRYILCLCNIFMYLYQHSAIKPSDTANVQLFWQ